MNTASPTEELLAGAISPTNVSREEVREWVASAREQTARANRRRLYAAVLAFLVAASAIWFSLLHQQRKIRQMVAIEPSKSLVQLNEITQELSYSQPAEYFVRQINRPKHRGFHSSASKTR